MLRFVVLSVAALLLFLVVRATVMSFVVGLRGGLGGRRRPEAGTRDELVKDPVCETYIPRSKAVARQTDAGMRYFCSGACAERFLARAADEGGRRS